MKTPYCKIDNVKYQLYWKDGVLRFPDDGRPMPDLNQMVIDYAEGKIPLKNLIDYEVNSGSSYERVFGIYSTNGINNHIVTQGKESTKKFALYLGKSYERENNKMKNKQIRLKEVYLKQIETEELDFTIPHMVFGKKYDDDDYQRGRDIVVGQNNKSWAGEAIPIPINMVRKILDKMEKAGADFVEIMHHTDHHSYVFNGMKITEATEEECKDADAKEKAAKEIENEMNKLKTQFKLLSEKLEKID